MLDLAQAYDLSQPGRYWLSYRAQPLTLTKGVAPSCPAIDFTRVAPRRSAVCPWYPAARRRGGHRQTG